MAAVGSATRKSLALDGSVMGIISSEGCNVLEWQYLEKLIKISCNFRNYPRRSKLTTILGKKLVC